MKVWLPALGQRRGFIADAPAAFTVCNSEGGGCTKPGRAEQLLLNKVSPTRLMGHLSVPEPS